MLSDLREVDTVRSVEWSLPNKPQGVFCKLGVVGNFKVGSIIQQHGFPLIVTNGEMSKWQLCYVFPPLFASNIAKHILLGKHSVGQCPVVFAFVLRFQF